MLSQVISPALRSTSCGAGSAWLLKVTWLTSQAPVSHRVLTLTVGHAQALNGRANTPR